MLLTKEQILKKKLDQEAVDCTKYGLNGSVIVQEMTSDDRDALELSVITGETVNTDHLRAKVVALSCVDAEGNKLFTMEDVEALGKVSGKLMVCLHSVAKRLSGLGVEEVEALSKNLESGKGDGSNSD